MNTNNELNELLESADFMELIGNEVIQEMNELNNEGWDYKEIQSIASIVVNNS